MFRRRMTTSWLLAATLAVLLVPGAASSVLAQENYPPGEPSPGPQVQVDCEVEVDVATRQVHCDGRGFAAGTEVTLEVFAAGGPNAMAPLATIGSATILAQGNEPVASGSSTVRPDGTFDVSAELDCTYERSRARAVIDGEGANGRNVTRTETVDVPSCEELGLVAAGDVDAPGSDGDVQGSLAFGGINVLLLALIAAALIAVGTFLVRRRNQQQGTTA